MRTQKHSYTYAHAHVQQHAQAAAQEDEIKRLRALLTSTTAELSRQISAFQSEGRQDSARVDWLQKLLLQVRQGPTRVHMFISSLSLYLHLYLSISMHL
jgi:hypothetical protein